MIKSVTFSLGHPAVGTHDQLYVSHAKTGKLKLRPIVVAKKCLGSLAGYKLMTNIADIGKCLVHESKLNVLKKGWIGAFRKDDGFFLLKKILINDMKTDYLFIHSGNKWAE